MVPRDAFSGHKLSPEGEERNSWQRETRHETKEKVRGGGKLALAAKLDSGGQNGTWEAEQNRGDSS